ncbi:MAG: MATE family efflux transporter [Thermodesulfobacteriota bacterium]
MKPTTEKRSSSQRNWVQGSVTGNLVTLSWPIMVHNALYMVGQTVDMIWIGRLGSAAVAGVGTAFIVHMLVLSAKMGLVGGARAMVARAIGSGDFQRANHIGTQAFVVSVLYGIFFSFLGLIFSSQIMSIFGLKPGVAALGADYMRMLFGGWIFYSLWLMAFSLMQSSGDATTPMYIHLFTRSVQLILSPFLVFGWWVFPRLGVQGAALAMIIGQALGMFISLWILFLGENSRLRLTLRGFRLDLVCIRQMIRIGLPALIMGVQGNLGQTVLMKIMVPFGTLAVAAHTLNQRVEMFVLMPGLGLGMGAGVLVGQNLGAKQPRRAEQTGWMATAILEGFMVLCAAAVLLLAPSLMRLFTIEPELIQIGSTFLRIAATGYLVQGFILCLQNAISGSGDTLPPMFISILSTWLILLPSAFLLPRLTGLGVYGIRWALVLSLVFGAAAYIVYFQKGRWKKKKV